MPNFMVTLNLTALITDGKVVHFSIDPGFLHDASVKDKREFYALKKVLDTRVNRFVRRRELGGNKVPGEDTTNE